MGEIKSALELALERTNSVQGDKKLLLKSSTMEKGRKAAFDFLENSDSKGSDIEKLLKSADNEEKGWIREGMFKVLVTYLKLPENEAALEKMARIRDAFIAISEKKKEISYLFGQVEDVFRQYLQNRKQVRENLDRNYAGKLREKEAALSKQLGQEVHLSAERDPEYLEYLHKMVSQLDEQYHEILIKIRAEIEKRL